MSRPTRTIESRIVEYFQQESVEAATKLFGIIRHVVHERNQGTSVNTPPKPRKVRKPRTPKATTTVDTGLER